MLFNETATTAIYPDFHTLSLRDALPLCSICRRRGLRAMPWSSLRWFSPRLPGLQVSLSRGPPDEHAHADRPDPWPGLCQGRDSSRSEEHTSELQSLMRISYAVFCLKKKSNNINTNDVKRNQAYTT